MARTPPTRGLAIRALELVRADPQRGPALVPEGEDGITPDAVLILVAIIDKLRDSYDAKNYDYDLRELVQTVCVRTPLDRAREYAYGKRLKQRPPLVLISAA
jgi:hypothetical protein